MNWIRILQIAALGLALASFAACGGDNPAGTGGGDDHGHEHGDHDHDHEHGPHGGMILLLGDHEYHVEVLHDLEASAVLLYAYDGDMKPVAVEGTPRLNLATSAGQARVDGVGIEEDGWRFVHESLAGEPDRARFQLVLGGQTWLPDLPEDHGHAHDDHDHGEHGPHDGVVAALTDGAGQIELKLHDDLGDLELWITKDGEAPLDLPLDAEIEVAFESHGKAVTLRVRDTDTNPDEDGQGNIREGKTNYFIFPGDTGADASWLRGGDFSDEVTVRFTVDGNTHETATFTLIPHTHHDGGHDHD